MLLFFATPIAFLLALPAGVEPDMLSLIDPEQYWEFQGQEEISTERLLAIAEGERVEDVSDLIEKLGDEQFAVREQAMADLIAKGPGVIDQLEQAAQADDPEVAERARRAIASLADAPGADPATRRLMAIRTLGEREAEAGLEVLQPLAEDDDAQIAEAATHAIARIRGEDPPKRPAPTREQIAEDVWLLPEDASVVFHAGRTEPALPDFGKMLYDYIAGIEATYEEVMGDVDDDMVRFDMDDPLPHALEIIDHAGNVRLDSITVGVTPRDHEWDPFEQVVAVARGSFDLSRFERRFADQKSSHEGVDYYNLGEGGPDMAAFFPLSDSRAVMVVGPEVGREHVHAMAERIKDGAGGFERNEELAAKVRPTLEEDGPAMFAMADLAPFLKHAPEPAKQLRKASLEVHRDGEALKATLRLGAEDQNVANTIGGIIRLAVEGHTASVRELAERDERYAPAAAVMASLEFDVEDGGIRIEGKADSLDHMIKLDMANMHLSFEEMKQWQHGFDDELRDPAPLEEAPPIEEIE